MSKPAWLFDGRLIVDHQQLKQIGFNVKAIGVYLNGDGHYPNGLIDYQ